MALDAPPAEIGWSSARTETRLGPVYTVIPCHPCNRAGMRWEEAEFTSGWVLVRCRECRREGWVAIKVGPA